MTTKLPMPDRLSDLLDRDCVAIRLNAGTAEDVIRRLASKLESKGLVRSTYAQAAVDRETTYPTGLPLGLAMNIAIPHTDPVHVIKPAIALATLAEPVAFASMEDPDETVHVGLVFLLAINDKDRQIDALQDVMTVVQSPETVERLLNADNLEDILSALDGRPANPLEDDDDD